MYVNARAICHADPSPAPAMRAAMHEVGNLRHRRRARAQRTAQAQHVSPLPYIQASVYARYFAFGNG
jgi:hypothetical protein